MPPRIRSLPTLFLALAPLAMPAAAAGPPFATELSLGFGYEGSSAERPLVVLDGVPSAAYAYSADGTAHTLDVAATRWFSPVGDDGRTPLALLPYVARTSGVTARFALSGASRDSFGSFSGQESSLEVGLAGDGTLREARLDAEWFAAKSLSVRGGLAYVTERETAASTSIERPSGRADVSTAGTRSSGGTGSLGVALRLGDHEVSASGSYGESDLTREDASAFTGSAQPYFSTLDAEGVVKRGTLATRLLFLGRRLALDASGSYAESTSSSSLGTTLSGPSAEGRALSRNVGAVATWFFTRRLGVSAGFAYGTRSVASGPPGQLRPSRSETGRAWSAGTRWFASERVCVSLLASRTGTDAVAPPDASTYQRFEDVVDRVTLGAALRF